jgi:NADH-quinone oxidoreductase subunit J
MSVGTLFFTVCALVCLIGAVSTVSASNPIRAAVGLLATIVGIAGLFLKLAAEFLAAIQLIVYAGAVVVLFVFVIMLLGPDARLGALPGRVRLSRWGGAALFVATALFALFGLRGAWGGIHPLPVPSVGYGSTEAVGGMLFHQGIVPFEIATALLIVAVVGAIAVARTRGGKRAKREGEHATKRLFGGPLHPRDAERPLPRATEAGTGLRKETVR